MNRKKNLIMICLGVALLLMVAGYAAFSTSLTITGTSNIKGDHWRVEITEIISNPTGEADNITDPTHDTLTANFNASFNKPGDKMTYTIKVKNSGKVDAIINDVVATAKGSAEIEYSIEGLQRQVRLAVGQETSFNIILEFPLEYTYMPTGASKTLNLEIICIQDEGQSLTPSDPIIENNDLRTKITGKNNANVVTTGDGLYVSTATNDGSPTYYYKGNVTNNYVSFANLTWRVIRINEDGTIKLILDGRIEYAYFNPNYNNYEYMYYSESAVGYGIKTIVDTWYNNTLKTNYDSYIATTSFCESSKVRYGNSYTSGNATMEFSSSYTPNFKCELDGNNKQYVNAKAGLITADEAAMAGIPLY